MGIAKNKAVIAAVLVVRFQKMAITKSKSDIIVILTVIRKYQSLPKLSACGLCPVLTAVTRHRKN